MVKKIKQYRQDKAKRNSVSTINRHKWKELDIPPTAAQQNGNVSNTNKKQCNIDGDDDQQPPDAIDVLATRSTNASSNTHMSSISSYESNVDSMKQFGYLPSLNMECSMLSNFIRDFLWSRCKFITAESQLDLKGDIASFMFTGLNIQVNQQKEFWERHRNFIRKSHNNQRNNRIYDLKLATMGMYKSDYVLQNNYISHRHHCN